MVLGFLRLPFPARTSVVSDRAFLQTEIREIPDSHTSVRFIHVSASSHELDVFGEPIKIEHPLSSLASTKLRSDTTMLLLNSVLHK